MHMYILSGASFYRNASLTPVSDKQRRETDVLADQMDGENPVGIGLLTLHQTALPVTFLAVSLHGMNRLG